MKALLILLVLLMLLLLPAAVVFGDDGDSDDSGDEISFVVSAKDPDNDQLQFSADLPEGATLDPVTGEFSWTPTHEQCGIWVFRFCASDGLLSDCEDVQIVVYDTNDVNRDLAVDILDLIAVSQHFGSTDEAWLIRADFDKDGDIDILDLIEVAQGDWRDYRYRY
jgi:hypothetical protein